MKYKAVVFDFDYTLGDSTEGIVLSANYGLENMGHAPADYDKIRRTIGLPLSDTYTALTGKEDPEGQKAFTAFFKEKADQVMTENTSLYERVPELLSQLKDMGIKTGIVTTKYHYRIEQIFKKYHIEYLLDQIVGSDDVKVPKPDPEGIHILLKTWGIKEKEMLYVGDSLVDAGTARAASVPFAAVTSGTTTSAMFYEFGYGTVVSGFEMLMEKVLEESEI